MPDGEELVGAYYLMSKCKEVKDWFLKQYQDQDAVYGWHWLDNNKVESEQW